MELVSNLTKLSAVVVDAVCRSLKPALKCPCATPRCCCSCFAVRRNLTVFCLFIQRPGPSVRPRTRPRLTAVVTAGRQQRRGRCVRPTDRPTVSNVKIHSHRIAVLHWLQSQASSRNLSGTSLTYDAADADGGGCEAMALQM